jgi:hypothetical protein
MLAPTPAPTFTLHSGSTLLAHVVPDCVNAGMYRIRWPDGRVSDLANLSRIKDAAETISERGPPPRNRRDFRWQRQAAGQAISGPLARSDGSEAA